jgi:hypothetical protein
LKCPKTEQEHSKILLKNLFEASIIEMKKERMLLAEKKLALEERRLNLEEKKIENK